MVLDASVDVLAGAFSAARARAVIFARLRLGAPWRVACPPADHAGFHIVECGSGWLEPDNGSRPIPLAEGDVVLVTRGAGHALADAPGSSATPQSVGLLARTKLESGEIVSGGDGPSTVLVCGGYVLEERLAAPFLWKLPAFVHLARARVATDAQSAVSLLLGELRTPQSGSPTMVNRLADVLLVHVLRDWLSALDEDERAWLVALQEGPVGSALALLHRDLAASWSVDALAGSVGLARAAFGRQFRAQVGEPPRSYVARNRMELAARLLVETDANLADVAAQVDYTSEYAFNRAFSRHHGISPGRYRRRARPAYYAQP